MQVQVANFLISYSWKFILSGVAFQLLLIEQKETQPKQLPMGRMDTVAGWVQPSLSHKPIL